MALKQLEEEKTMILESEEFMIKPYTSEIPTFRKAHFLKPLLNPTNQPHSEPPFLPQSSNPGFIEKVSKLVLFRGTPYPNGTWKTWVSDLLKSHQSIWKKVGIFDAIMCSTYRIKKNNELIVELGQKWCVETNTFVFPWGECTITLEDIMILGGFPVLGVSVLTPCQRRDFDEIEGILVHSCSAIRSSNNLVTHNGWMKYFKGRGGELEHVAFLVLWLSRYVFATESYNTIATNAFALAISLAKGTNVALAHAVLASIYRDLSLLNEKIVNFMYEGQVAGSNLVLTAPFQLVQVWAWERFPRLGPNPFRLSFGEPRLARWRSVKKLKFCGLRLQDVESDGSAFLWRPYVLGLMNWEVPRFYCDQEVWVEVDSTVDDQILSFAKCLMNWYLVGVDCMELYLPHRVGMQFGMDQDIPCPILRLNADLELALSSYEKSLHGLKFYLPSRLFKGGVTINYYNWWWRTLSRPDDSPITIHERNTSEIPICSSIEYPCVETVGFSAGKPCHDVANDYDQNEAMKFILWFEEGVGKSEQNSLEETMGNEIEGGMFRLGVESKHSEGNCSENEPLFDDHETSSRNEPLLGTDRNIMCCMLAADEQGEGVNQDADINNLVDDLVSISDGDNTSPEQIGMESEFKLDVRMKHSEDYHSQNETMLQGCETFSTEEPLLGTKSSAEDQGKGANRDSIITLADDPAVISDEEGTSHDPFEKQCLELEARISRLEKIVSALQLAKFGSSAS